MLNIKALLVEDNPGDVLLMEEMLENSPHYNFEIQSTSTLSETIEVLKITNFDIVLLDLGLPDSVGLEAVESLVKLNIEVPIVVVTGLDDEGKGREAIKTGAQSYVIKGKINSESIVNTISHAIERFNILQKLRKNESSLVEKNKLLLDANHSKEKLISIISHDLRGPIGGLVSLLEVLSENFDYLEDDKKKYYLNSGISSGKNILELAEDLLSWARSQSNHKIAKPEILKLESVVKEALRPLQDLADKKEIDIILLLPEKHIMYADRNMMFTVMRNLLSNAIKFTRVYGTIKIRSKLLNDNSILITIEDNGIGIAEENISKIFNINDVFTTRGTENEKGSGFGLILCKEFIETNNGTIHIESVVKKGTKISVRLPIDDSWTRKKD